jgi:AraC-like DNA-binding protein
MTSRYVHKLFANEGLTFSSFVLGQRLARAHRMLSDPRRADRTIGAVAFDIDFGDLSYFNRTFRRQYGATPTNPVQRRWVRLAGRQGSHHLASAQS